MAPAPLRILVTRPQPAAAATASRLSALGHVPIVMPLLATEPVPWALPAESPQGLLLTSAAALRHAGAGLRAFAGLPAYAVGDATAAAARAAGLTDIRTGAGGVQTLVDGLAAAGAVHLLHLAGEDRTSFVTPRGMLIDLAIVYRARLLATATLLPADWVLLYSARTAAHFAAEVDRHRIARTRFAIAAISPTALAAAGGGWGRAVAAATPDEGALLAAIGAACQKAV